MSLTEFLVCSPVVALLAFGAYDLNKRVEDQQMTAIHARNAALLGKNPQTAPTLNRILDAQERGIVSGSGLTVTVHDKQELDGQFTQLDRVRRSMANGTSFDTISTTTGNVGAAASRVVAELQNTGESLGLFIKDGIRVADVVTEAPGTANGMQRTIGTLTEVTTGNPQAGAEAAALARRTAQRSFLHWETGYHPSQYTNFPIAGIALGLSKTAWDADGDFSHSSDGIQTRCMTRLLTSDQCQLLGFREFYYRTKAIAEARMDLSEVLFESDGYGAAADIIITQGVKKLTSHFMNAAISTLTDQAISAAAAKATDEISAKLKAELSRLASIPGHEAGKLSETLNSNELEKKIGGGS